MTNSAPPSPASSSTSRGRAILLIVLAALFWSTSGFFAKANVFAGWPPLLLGFWRAVFACVVLVPMVRRPVWTWKLVPMALSFVLMNITFVSAMVYGTAANAIWLQGTAPVWVLLAGVLFFRESSRGLDWLLIALCTAGIVVILFCESYYQGESRERQLTAVLLGLASGVFYGGVVLSLRLLRSIDAAWLVAVNHLATVVCLSWTVPWTGIWPSGSQWAYLAGFGMFQMGLSYLLFARGVRTLTGHEAAGIGLLEPVLAPLWVYLAWSESPAWWTLVGGGLILLGLAVRYLADIVLHRPDPTPPPTSSPTVKSESS